LVLPVAREVGRPESIATAQFNLGLACLLADDRPAAGEHLAGALAAYAEMDDVDGVGYVLIAAAAFRAEADARTAAAAIGAADAALASVGSSLEAVEARVRGDTLAAVGATLGPDGVAGAVADGAAMPPERWSEFAAEILRAGHVCLPA
jgi:hypothetical protein